MRSPAWTYLCLTMAALGCALFAVELFADDFPAFLLVTTALGVAAFGRTGIKRLRPHQ